MTKILLIVAGVFALFASTVSTVSAAPQAAELTPKQAAALIAIRSGVPLNSIVISFIVEGESQCGKGFAVNNVRRVASIHGVREGSKQSRQLVFYDLFWNDTLGWFMWESRSERTGDAVYIWSELKGEIVNR